MSVRSYDTIGFVQDGSDFDLTRVEHELTHGWRGAKVTRLGDKISVSTGGWSGHIRLSDEPYVAEESRAIAAHFSACPRAADIALCRRQLDIWSDDPDPNGVHVNDFIFLQEVVSGFSGVILLDPLSGTLL